MVHAYTVGPKNVPPRRAVVLLGALATLLIVIPAQLAAQSVLVVGGEITSSPILYTSSAEVYNPATATWSTANNVPNPPPDFGWRPLRS
jgi:hypothetical protein